MERELAIEIVKRGLAEVFAQTGETPPTHLDQESVLVGTDAVIDSLGVVSLIVEVESIVEREHEISIILANEKAMSAKNSPFRTIGVLADHVCSMVLETEAA